MCKLAATGQDPTKWKYSDIAAGHPLERHACQGLSRQLRKICRPRKSAPLRLVGVLPPVEEPRRKTAAPLLTIMICVHLASSIKCWL